MPGHLQRRGHTTKPSNVAATRIKPWAEHLARRLGTYELIVVSVAKDAVLRRIVESDSQAESFTKLEQKRGDK